MTISNITDDYGTLGIAGPFSRHVLSKLTDTDMSHEKFKFLTVKDIEIEGIPVKALRLSYTGEACNYYVVTSYITDKLFFWEKHSSWASFIVAAMHPGYLIRGAAISNILII